MRINGVRIKSRLRPNGKRRSISFSLSRRASLIRENGSRNFTRSNESWQTRRLSFRSSPATLFQQQAHASETFLQARCSLTRCGMRTNFSSNPFEPQLNADNADQRLSAFICGKLSVVLFGVDGEIDRFRDVAANTECICSGCKVTKFDRILLGDRDNVPIRVQQLEIDPLVAVVLVELRIEPATSKRKRHLN